MIAQASGLVDIISLCHGRGAVPRRARDRDARDDALRGPAARVVVVVGRPRTTNLHGRVGEQRGARRRAHPRLEPQVRRGLDRAGLLLRVRRVRVDVRGAAVRYGREPRARRAVAGAPRRRRRPGRGPGPQRAAGRAAPPHGAARVAAAPRGPLGGPRRARRLPVRVRTGADHRPRRELDGRRGDAAARRRAGRRQGRGARARGGARGRARGGPDRRPAAAAMFERLRPGKR